MRDFLWAYPKYVILFVREFKTFFKMLSGFIVGILLMLLLVLFLSRGIDNRTSEGTLRIAYVGTLDNINPLDPTANEASEAIISLVYNGLVNIDSTGSLITPELADTWEQSPDGKTYTFFLKKGVLWHDGVELTAGDVAFTYELLQSAGDGSGIGAIVSDIEVDIVGPYEVSFTLPQINSAFFETMTMSIIPKHIYEGFTYSRFVEQGDIFIPIGTGIYKVESLDDDYITLTANDQYFKTKPNINNVIINVYPTFSLAEIAFLNGDVTMLSPIPYSDLDQYIKFDEKSEHIKINGYTQVNNTRVLLFNVKDEKESLPLKVRKAISLGIEKDVFSEVIPDVHVAYGPYPDTSPIFTPEMKNLVKYDPFKAYELLESAGWTYEYSGAPFRNKKGEELSMKLTFLDTESNRKVAQIIAAQIRNLGINVTLDGISSSTLQQQVISQHDFEVLLFEIQNGIDPDQYGLWHSEQTEFPGLNIGGFASDEVDLLLEKGRLQPDLEERLSIYNEFQQALVKEVPVVFLYHPVYYELSYDVIERDVIDSILTPADRYNNIDSWVLMPEWRNRQTR